MKRRTDEENHVMIGQTDWYAQAGKRPFREDGFTLALMTQIEQAATAGSIKTHKRFRVRKSFVFTALAMLLLLGTLIWPFREWRNGHLASSPLTPFQAAAPMPTVTPTATGKDYVPPIGSAEFEFSGKKYYMPLPLDRNKERAYAAETSAGIIWSPAPPVVNYTKPKYTHPTEPYTLYLSPKDQPELSAATALRVYTYPLYAGGAQSYYDLGTIYGVGDYALIITGTFTLGTNKRTEAELSLIDTRKVSASKVVVPRNLLTFDSSLSLYRSYLAIDKQNEELLLVNYTDNKKGGFDQHAKLYDLESGHIQQLDSVIRIDINGTVETVIYEVKGEKRTAEMGMKLGQQWYLDQFEQQ
ncbi:hypothetical protein [Paenibacillus monticola]|uniref:Uncharacterized protein n=1 Tax=Paenibacillus monticola TaxID=2666075 RepID=A0A7X2L3C8_9BACL|nr:hypothetical protein [Paenibacillus monticola]MRN55777.1 hypothetical protein [Paenibacillus monticola]